MRFSRQTAAALFALALVTQFYPAAHAQLPIQGMPVPDLDVFDNIMQTYLTDNDINAGILGIMKDQRIVYLRAFGYKDEALSVNLPENALMRVASVTKPVTAAAVRVLIDWGTIGLNQHVFKFEPADDGILDYEPWGGLGDDRLDQITVEHLLRHRGGWDRASPIGDLTRMEVQIAQEMGFDPYRVPTRAETVEWIMGQPLQFPPDSTRVYSNIGYLILGLIVEQVSGTDLRTFWREFVLDDSMWFPASEFEPGRTFAVDQNPREPWYDNNQFNGQNVFDPDGPSVPLPYGSWNHEARVGQGGLITGAVPLLNYLARYYVNGDLIGEPLAGAEVLFNHGGRLTGTEALARQRGDGVNYVIMLNKAAVDPPGGSRSFAQELKVEIDNMLDSGFFTWPTQAVDGVWIDFMHSGPEQGTYDEPFDSVLDLGQVMAYSKVRFKSGTTSWTGVIDRGHIALSAPEGPVVIGQ